MFCNPLKSSVSILIILSQYFVSHVSFAQFNEVDSTANKIIYQGIHQIHVEQYDEAIGTFRELLELYPDNIIGYFYIAATYQTIMRNYRISFFESQFGKFLNKAIEIGEKSIDGNKKDLFTALYLGGAYGFRGLHKVRKRDWLGALNDGLKGINYLERTVSIDPHFYDAYYGLGVFHYWRTVKTKLPGFLSFVKKDRQKGIKEVLLTINKGKFTQIEGKYALVEIYYNHGDFKKAFEVNKSLYDIFPTNPACLYMRYKILEKLENWKEAGISCRKLLEHLKSSNYSSIGYEVECYYNLALCSYETDNFELALNEINNAMELKSKRDNAKEIEGPLDDFNDVVKKAEKLYKNIKKKIKNQK